MLWKFSHVGSLNTAVTCYDSLRTSLVFLQPIHVILVLRLISTLSVGGRLVACSTQRWRLRLGRGPMQSGIWRDVMAAWQNITTWWTGMRAGVDQLATRSFRIQPLRKKTGRLTKRAPTPIIPLHRRPLSSEMEKSQRNGTRRTKLSTDYSSHF